MSKRQWNQTTTDLHQSGSRHENPRTGQQDQPRKRPSHIQYANLLFYQGKIPAEPEGVYVDVIHRQWSQDMDRLERNHNYIQWLFPTREDGQNAHAQVLQAGEAAAIAADRDAMKRFFKSYQMMLHFYGLTIVNRGTGEVGRGQNWERQLRNLNASRHNYLRITRILKSLGEMGLEHFQAPLVRALLTEAIEKGTLNNARDSCYNYWIPTVRDPGERENLEQYAHRYDTVRKSVESRSPSSLCQASRTVTRAVPQPSTGWQNMDSRNGAHCDSRSDNKNLPGRQQPLRKQQQCQQDYTRESYWFSK